MEKKNFWYEFGFGTAGVIVSNYALWLIQQFKQNDIEQVILFARDGYILKELFDIYSEKYTDLPKYDYVLASRRAYLIPALSDDLNRKDILNILGLINLNYKNLNERLSYLGIEEHNFEPYFKEFQDIFEDKVLTNPQKRDKLIETKFMKEVLIKIKEVSIKERGLLEKHFREFDVLNSSKVATVDGFGHGTCQNYFIEILNFIENEIEDVKGFYMGTYAPYHCEKKYDINQKAYMFNLEKPNYTQMPISDAYIFELFFGATHGSFINFKETQNNSFEPAFDKDGKFRKDIIEVIQRGIIDYFKKHIDDTNKPCSGEIILDKCIDFMRKPSLEEAINIGNIPVIDADVDRGFFIAKPKLAHLFTKELKYLWKEAYFKRLNPFL